jgi:hypothetical protein
MRIGRKGLSDIVTNVLIILLVLVAIGIIWYFVSPFIRTSAGGVTSAQQYQIKLEVVPQSAIVDASTSNVQLLVRRGSGKGNLTGFMIVLEDMAGNSKSFRQNIPIAELETKSFTQSYAGSGLGTIKSVSIAPILSVNGKEVQGAVSSTQSPKSGTVAGTSQTTFTLSVVALAGGEVNSVPSGIRNCRSNGGTCSFSFSQNSQVTLTSTPDANYAFTGWSGAGCSGISPCQVTMGANRAVTAQFLSVGIE